MTTILTIADQTASGQQTGETVVEFLTETVTVREMIRARVWQEVNDFNHYRPEKFRGLVQPAETEQEFNGPHDARPKRTVDFKKQFDVACTAFDRNGYFVLVDDRQVRRSMFALRAFSGRPRIAVDVQDSPGQREHSDGTERPVPLHRT
jgi:hypothetical protein